MKIDAKYVRIIVSEVSEEMQHFKVYLLCSFLVLKICNFNAIERCADELQLKLIAPSSVYEEAGALYTANSSYYGQNLYFKYNDGDDILTFSKLVNNSKKSSDSGNDTFFDVIEIPPTINDFTEGYLIFPIMIGALVFFHNIQNVSHLILTPEIIADIYSSNIVYWNDSSIQMFNPQLNLPYEKIVVAGTDTSKVDAYFVSWMFSSYSKSWNQQYGTSITWQNSLNRKIPKKNYIKFILDTQNSIGFSSAENVHDKSPLPYSITIMNWKGVAVNPSGKSVQAAARSIPIDKLNSFDALLYLKENCTSGSYPFIYFDYIVISTANSLKNDSCCAMREIVGYIDSFLDFMKVSTSFTRYGFSPLTVEVVQYIRATVLPLVTCNATSLYDDYVMSRVVPLKPVNKGLLSSEIATTVCVVAGAVIAVMLAGFGYYQRCYKLVSNESFWKINSSELIFIDQKNTSLLSTISLRSTQTSTNMKLIRDYSNLRIANWKRNDMMVMVNELPSGVGPVTEWRQTTKLLVYKFIRDFNDQNLCSMHGISVIQNRPCLINQFFSKGTLNHVLDTCPFDLLIEIKYSLAHNVISGLKYLHQKLMVHGSLSSITCFVDDTWNVKIANWALLSIAASEIHVSKKIAPLCSETRNTTAGEETDAISELIKMLYTDPDSMYPNTRSTASDLYSLGMLLLEIFTRQLPYNAEVEMSQTTYAEIIRKKMIKVECIPQMPVDVPNGCRPLILSMIGPSECRPDIIAVAKEFQQLVGNRKQMVVDVMMKLMEKHMENLEEKVIERTSELVNVTNRMRDLLNAMLPPQIADKFIRGETVKPEFYECATIFFSDIVGFTTISTRSTPYQVMNLLNDLWQLFDDTMEKFDAYKVDTIGDAYMIASGLPIRNGVNHCSEVAQFALTLLKESQTFSISHLPDEILRVRMGINSGPVTAGIVGHKMPQYCIFGDTVNTASRMESSSLPMKIHVSEFSHKLYEMYFPHFQFDYRGEIEIKGKGLMKTYWLLNSACN